MSSAWSPLGRANNINPIQSTTMSGGGAVAPMPIRTPIGSPIQSTTVGSGPLYNRVPLQNPTIQNTTLGNSGPIGANGNSPVRGPQTAGTGLGGIPAVNPASVAPNPNMPVNAAPNNPSPTNPNTGTSTGTSAPSSSGAPNYATFQQPATTFAQATQGGNGIGSYIYNLNLQQMQQQANQWNANLPAGDTNYATVDPTKFAQYWNSFSNGPGLGNAPAQNFWNNAPSYANTQANVNAGTASPSGGVQPQNNTPGVANITPQDIQGQAVNTQGGAFGTPNPNWVQPQPGQNTQNPANNNTNTQTQPNYLAQLQQLFAPNYTAQQASPLGYTSWNQTNPFYSNGNPNSISTNNTNPNQNSFGSILSQLLGYNSAPQLYGNTSNSYAGMANNIMPSQGNGTLQSLLSLLNGSGMSALTGQQNTGQYL